MGYSYEMIFSLGVLGLIINLRSSYLPSSAVAYPVHNNCTYCMHMHAGCGYR